MNLVPYTLTALSRQDIPDTPQNRNIVVGAVVTCTDSAGATVAMFDDASGSNGSTAKQTGVNGQVTVFVEPGEYTFTVNGRPNKVVVGNPKQVSSVASIDALRLQAGRFDGQQISLSGYYAGANKGGGVFVWDAASTAADDGGVTIAVTGVTTGRWVRQLDGFVTPEMFGARGGGVTNDTLAINAAVLTRRTVALTSGETYKHSPLSYNFGVDLISVGGGLATMLCTNDSPSQSVLASFGSEKTATTLSADAPAGVNVITLASIDNVLVGDLLKIVGTTLWPDDARGSLYFGQLAKVVRIVGNSVYLEAPIANGLPAGSLVVPATPVKVNINGIRFKREKTTGSTSGLFIRYDDGGRIHNCEMINLSRMGAQVSECYMTTITNPVIVSANLAVSAGVGYGVGVGSSYRVLVSGGTMRECRRGVDIGGSLIPSFYCEVSGNTVYGGGLAEDGASEFWPNGAVLCDGIGSHGGAEGTIFKGNILIDVRGGVTIRGRKEIVIDNTFVGKILRPLDVVHGASIQIRGNRYYDQFEYALSTMSSKGGVVSASTATVRPEYFVYVNVNNYDVSSGLTVENNIVNSITKSLVYLDGNSGVTMHYLVVKGNEGILQNETLGAIVSLVSSGSNKFIPNFVIYNNDFKSPSTNDYVQLSLVNAISQISSVNKIGNSLYHVTITDDGFVEIDTGYPTSQKMVKIAPSSNSAAPRLNKVLRNNSSIDLEFGGSTGFTVLGEALSGVTGVDGAWSVSLANNSIWIENRTGSTGALIVSVDA